MHRKFYGDRPRITPPSGELNPRMVAKYSDFGHSKAISRKRCKIGGKLVLITNRKSHMRFQLVPKSVALNDLERRSGVISFISAKSVKFGAHCVKVVEDIPKLSATENVVQSF